MKTPPLLIGATLMFWGWQTGYLIFAAVMAVLLECSNFISLKWDVSSSGFNRISDVCNLIFLSAAVFIFITTRSASAILVLIQWLPMILLPLLLFQMYSTSDNIDVRAILLLMRKKRKKELEKYPKTINLTYPYVVVCVVSASAANMRTFWFYPAVFLLTAWALWPNKSRRYSLPLWFSLLFVAGLGGYWGHIGLHKLQLSLEEKGLVWFEDLIREDRDPYRNRTAIGDIGKLKLSDRIVFRVKHNIAPTHPVLLREASYNKYNASGWFAFRAGFSNIHPENNQIAWDSRPARTANQSLDVSSYLKGGKGLLKLPTGTFQIKSLPLNNVKQNQYGAVKIEEGPGLLNYQVYFGSHSFLDSPPGDADLSIPEQEKATLSSIVQELDLGSLQPQQILDRVHTFFQQKFKYSLSQSKHNRFTTPLTHFLRHSRSGHCEFFATASVLLLRAAGIPARYASGYSVQEFSRWENCFVVRAKHAHAWALAFIDGEWRDFDATPSSWVGIEKGESSIWRDIKDFSSWCWLKFSEWRWLDDESGATIYAWLLIIPMLIILARKLYFKKHIKRHTTGHDKAFSTTSYPGTESEFYLIEKRLNEWGLSRHHWEPLSSWLQRIKESRPSQETIEAIDDILALHYRYRFDPKGIPTAEKALLKSKVESWLGEAEELS